jgi:hypothetical protein
MTVQYTGNKVGSFTRKDYKFVVNGTRAAGALVGSVLKNQSWLAFEDPGAVNFWAGPAIRLSATGPSGEADIGTVLVEVPPNCVFVDFWFLAVRQEDPEAVTPGPAVVPGAILVDSPTGGTVRVSVSPTHALKTLPSIQSAKWHMVQLRVRSNPEPVWSEEWVNISTTAEYPGIWLFSAYYQTVAPAESVVYDDLTP